jgi:hypothetical protein
LKQTIVPAQITTVEDKIAGSLSLTQMVLLMAPIFIGASVFVVFPPVMVVAPFKVGVVAIISLVLSLMAIRVADKIVLVWTFLVLRYNLRARFYVYDKNDSYMRASARSNSLTGDFPMASTGNKREPSFQLSLAKRIKLESIISSPDASLSIRASDKGKLRLVITK